MSPPPMYPSASSQTAPALPLNRAPHSAHHTPPPAEGYPACVSCGTARVGPHCHTCGQGVKAERRLTIGTLVHDLVHFVTHLDHGLPHTLRALFRSPGDLARRYVAGDRAHITSPLTLLLLSATLVLLTYPLYESALRASIEAQTVAQWAGMNPEGRAAMVKLFGTPEHFAASMLGTIKSQMKAITFLNAVPLALMLAALLRRRHTIAEWLVASMFTVAAVNIVTAFSNPLLLLGLPALGFSIGSTWMALFNVSLYVGAAVWMVRRFWGPGWKPTGAAVLAYGASYAIIMLVAGLFGLVFGIMNGMGHG